MDRDREGVRRDFGLIKGTAFLPVMPAQAGIQ
jgi:hypothetical protein